MRNNERETSRDSETERVCKRESDDDTERVCERERSIATE